FQRAQRRAAKTGGVVGGGGGGGPLSRLLAMTARLRQPVGRLARLYALACVAGPALFTLSGHRSAQRQLADAEADWKASACRLSEPTPAQAATADFLSRLYRSGEDFERALANGDFVDRVSKDASYDDPTKQLIGRCNWERYLWHVFYFQGVWNNDGNRGSRVLAMSPDRLCLVLDGPVDSRLPALDGITLQVRLDSDGRINQLTMQPFGWHVLTKIDYPAAAYYGLLVPVLRSVITFWSIIGPELLSSLVR
uniref:CRAL-TRIO domain-containing protein n=2 Tax=Macrostomum lignano TaxID=282301 RepID=A0A1I8IMP5_9PLAT